MKFIEKYKQYGLINLGKRVVYGLLSKIGICINHWLVCTQDINLTELKKIEIKDEFKVKEMNLTDFTSCGKFDSNKLSSFDNRLSEDSYKAFGVYSGNELAYYCWISLTNFDFIGNPSQIKLSSNEGLLFDAYCFPDYRGNKLHNYMNAYRIVQLSKNKKTKALVVLLKENTPARKSQKRVGFTCSKIITSYNIFGKEFSQSKQKTINL